MMRKLSSLMLRVPGALTNRLQESWIRCHCLSLLKKLVSRDAQVEGTIFSEL